MLFCAFKKVKTLSKKNVRHVTYLKSRQLDSKVEIYNITKLFIIDILG